MQGLAEDAGNARTSSDDGHSRGVGGRRVPDSALAFQRAQLQEFVGKSRLPSMFGLREHAEVGGLMSYTIDLIDIHRRAAIYVDQILRGAKAGDLPIEQPTKYELVINLKTAKALGVTIPPAVLARADHVIQ
jgi:putative ABC transport system substrate-binding protein